jgi:hypothetical protein
VGDAKEKRSGSTLLKRRSKMHLFKSREPKQLKSGQTHAVWMKEFSAVDIWSRRFIRQKLNYIHMNPVRAGLCDHPGKWRWSSYQAYMPHEPGTVPIEVDKRWLWSEEELRLAHGRRTSALSKQEENNASEDELNSAHGGRASALSKRKT